MVFAPSTFNISFLTWQHIWWVLFITSPCLMLTLKLRIAGERVFSFGERLLIITWYFIVLVLTQSYTASLASLLTSQQLHPTITSMISFLENEVNVGYPKTSFIFRKFKELGFSQSILIPFDTAENCHKLLRKGQEKGGFSAAFMKVSYIKLFLGQYCKSYQMVEEPFNVDGFGFVSFHTKTSVTISKLH